MAAENNSKRTLLTAADPALFEVVNHSGGAPAMVCCDHAGLALPAALGDLGVPAAAMATHIASDLGAGRVSQILADKFDAPLLRANYSRLAIDLNRHLDDPTLIPEVSDGVKIPGNANLSRAQRRRRIDELFTPYHQRFGQMVDDLRARFAKPMIVSVHSFAPRMNGQARPWEFGVLWLRQREVAQAVIANLRRQNGRDGERLCVGDNQPYHAGDPLGYAMVAHAQAREVDMVLLEIRQDLIDDGDDGDGAGAQWAAEVLYRAIAPLLDSRRRR